MSRMSLIDKYQLLFEKCISPKALDCSRGTYYTFEKYCRHCLAGLKKTARHDPRPEKALYKKSYCSNKCKNLGPVDDSTFKRSVKQSASPAASPMALDDMASLSIAIERMESRLPKFVKLVLQAEFSYRLISEKLSFLEMQTNVRWDESKFYYWARKLGI